MFGSVVDGVPAVGGPMVRAPFAVMAARPVGVEAAYHLVQLAGLLRLANAAAADPAVSADPPGCGGGG